MIISDIEHFMVKMFVRMFSDKVSCMTSIQGCLLNLIGNYLKNREQCVEINNIRTAFTNILTGVPQGSTLGPLLFIIYMNDIPFASTIFKTIIYADDTTLLANLSDFCLKNNTKLN